MTGLIGNMKSYFEKSKRWEVVAAIEAIALSRIITLGKIQILERKIIRLSEIFRVMKNLDFADNPTKMTKAKIKV